MADEGRILGEAPRPRVLVCGLNESDSASLLAGSARTVRPISDRRGS